MGDRCVRNGDVCKVIQILDIMAKEAVADDTFERLMTMLQQVLVMCYTFLTVSKAILTGPFLASIRHSCLLCQLCLEQCFETVRMRLKVTQSIVEVVYQFLLKMIGLMEHLPQTVADYPIHQ